MTTQFTLKNLDPNKLPNPKEARERTLAAIEQYKDASKRLEDVCKEKGIEVPELVM